MEILIAGMAFLSTFLFLYGFFSLRARSSRFNARLTAIASTDRKMSLDEAELAQPFRDRVLLPVLSGLGAMMAKYTPKGLRNRTALGLAQAGYSRMDPAAFFGIRAIIAVGLTGTAMFLAFTSGVDRRYMTLYILFFPMIGFMLPDLWLRMAGKQRKAAIAQSLPDLLDLLTVSVEAGLGFDQALVKSSEKLKGPLNYEVKRTFHEIQMGNARVTALRAMSDRVGMDDLTSFTAALIQADQFGVSIASVLRVQSDAIRVKRRQRAEETAMKAPLKLLFPLIIFIFPTLFLILLGPAILNMMENFASK